MKTSQFTLLVALCIGFVTTTFAQRPNYQIRSSLGITGGITNFNINTDNFETSAGTGWLAGLQVKGNLPHKWYDVSAGIQFTQSKLNMSGRISDDVTGNEEIEYQLLMAQAFFMFHWKIVPNHFEVDFGPVLQFSDKLKFTDENQESFFINGYEALPANQIVELAPFNVNAAVGLTAGFKPFRFRFQYQYGITNMLRKLNDQNLNTLGGDDEFKGNQSMIVGTAIIYF